MIDVKICVHNTQWKLYIHRIKKTRYQCRVLEQSVCLLLQIKTLEIAACFVTMSRLILVPRKVGGDLQGSSRLSRVLVVCYKVQSAWRC